jgi:hypothetical protein
VFIFGLGYTGLAIAQSIRDQFPDCSVCGTCRTLEKAKTLRHLGLDACVFNPDDSYEGLDSSGIEALVSSSHILTTIPPVADFDKDPVLEFHRKDILSAKGESVWAGYISTTGVYGNHDGDWVTEDSQCLVAKSTKTYHRLAAERDWLNLREQVSKRHSNNEALT